MFISLDLETTGFDAEEDKIIEFGAVKFDFSGKKETLRFFVNPGITIPQIITHITNISDQDLKTAAPFSEKTAEIQKFIGNLPIIGHNIKFDINFLQNNGLKFNNDTYDTQELASILLPNIPSYSLEILSKKLNLTHHEKHRALDDAIAAMELFIKLIKKFKNLDKELIKKIQIFCKRSNWPTGNLLTQNNKLEFTRLPDINTKKSSKETLKNDAMRENKESPPEPYYLVRRQGDDEVDEAERVFQRFPSTLFSQILTQSSASFFELIPPYDNLIQYLSTHASKDTYISIPYHLFRQIHNGIPDTVAKIDIQTNYISLARLEEFSQKTFFENHELTALLKYIIWENQTKTGLLSEVALFHEEHTTISRVNIDENIANPEEEYFFKKALEKDKSLPALCTHQYLIQNPPTEQNIIIIDFENFLHCLHRDLSIYLKLEPIINILKSLQEFYPENQTVQTLINKTTILFGLLGIIFEKNNDQNIFTARSTINETILQTKEWTESQKSLNNLIEISHELKKINNKKTFGYLKQWKNILKALHEILQTPDILKNLVWLEKDQNGNIVLRKLPYSFKNELQNILNKNKNYQIIDETLDLNDDGLFMKNLSGLPQNLPLHKLSKKSENLEIYITKDTDGSDKNKIPNFITDYYNKKSKKIAIIFNAKKDLEFMTLKLSQANLPVIPQLAGSLGKIQELFINEKKASLSPILLLTPYVWKNFEYQDEFDTVFIYKLPFEPPSDPQLIALSQNYENPFIELQVPRTVIETKKIINRLQSDTNQNKKVVILDQRLTNRDYAEIFIKNLQAIGPTMITKLKNL